MIYVGNTPIGTIYLGITPTSNIKIYDPRDAFKIFNIPSQQGILNYSGDPLFPEWNDYDEKKLLLGGVLSATEIGTYEATFQPINNYTWADYSTTVKNVFWTIDKGIVSLLPSQNAELRYTGESQTPSWNNYENDKLIISGSITGIEAGEYFAIFAPTNNYMWEDGTSLEKVISWTIKRAILLVPSQKTQLIYTGEVQSPNWNNYDENKMNYNVNSQVDANTYYATFTSTSNYCWEGINGELDEILVPWTINRNPCLIIPSQMGSLTYNESHQSPSWYNYESDKMIIGGTQSAINAGTYSVTFTPKSNYAWADGTYEARTVQWIIQKSPVTIINQIPAISGTSGWSNGVSSTAYTLFSPNSILLSSTTNNAEVTTETTNTFSLISGHKYYIRAYVYFPSGTTVRRTSCYWPVAEPAVWNSSSLGLTLVAGQWHLLGMISDRSEVGHSPGDYPLRIDFDNDYKAGNMYFDGVMIIDLTESFGSGNEPNQSWCNNNIPYFTGSMSITPP